MRIKNFWFILLALTNVLLVGCNDEKGGPASKNKAVKPAQPSVRANRPVRTREWRERMAAQAEADALKPDSELSEEERRQVVADRLVEAFDELTDNWQEAREKPPTKDEIDGFAKKFSELPQDRKEACLYRVRDLLPDENSLLLVGLLRDQSVEPRAVRLVLDDILLRDESVRQELLNAIMAEPGHPCRDFAASALRGGEP